MREHYANDAHGSDARNVGNRATSRADSKLIRGFRGSVKLQSR